MHGAHSPSRIRFVGNLGGRIWSDPIPARWPGLHAPQRQIPRMELTIFARLYALEGQESAVVAAMRRIAGPTREEPGCLELHYYRSIQDPRLFQIWSRWVDEAAFNRPA